jgi:hypothetical protein
MKPMVCPDDNFKYYAYVLLYIDDLLVIGHDAKDLLNKIDFYFKMKPDSKGDRDMYLGSKIRKFKMPNGVDAWVQSPSQYIQEVCKNMKHRIQKKYNASLPKNAPAPFPRDYISELDTTEELGPEDGNYFQSLISILRWTVELGRIDIITEVSKLASHMALTRQGHLEAVFHIFAYLKEQHNYLLALDPTYPEIDDGKFNVGADWKEMYPGAEEMIPPNMPEPRGLELVLRLFVDSDHAGDKLIRRSRSGYIIYPNCAPILWMSKRQGTIKSLVFGAEFVAMKVRIEAARGPWYKLRMMGIQVNDPVYILGDNMSVIHNTSKPESVLKKKSNWICYHFIRESVAMGESLAGHVRSEENPADICTKVIAGGMKRETLTRMILYNGGEDVSETIVYQPNKQRRKIDKSVEWSDAPKKG